MPARVALLHDASAAAGRPDSSDTLAEVEAIASVLVRLGYEPRIVPVGLDLGALEGTLGAIAPYAVFNLVESLQGHGTLLGAVPALLDVLRLPFTGCSAQALVVTSDKRLAKRLLQRAGLPSPSLFDGGAAPDTQWIVKSVFEHASLGIDDSSVTTTVGVPQLVGARAAEFGGHWFAERYLPGRELNVAIIAAPGGPRVLPVAEIKFAGFPAAKPAIVGYAAKWDPQSFEYHNTVRSFAVEPELARQVADLALACWELFGLEGYARIDFRVDAAGAPWVLEVNANPCLAPDAGYAAALSHANIAYELAVDWLVGAARRRAAGLVGARR